MNLFQQKQKKYLTVSQETHAITYFVILQIFESDSVFKSQNCLSLDIFMHKYAK